VNLNETFVSARARLEESRSLPLLSWWNFDGLEATLERAIFFNRLAKLSRRSGADALHLRRAKGPASNVAASSEPSAEPAPTNVCKLVDENDVLRISTSSRMICFKTFFKLAAILGARHVSTKGRATRMRLFSKNNV